MGTRRSMRALACVVALVMWGCPDSGDGPDASSDAGPEAGSGGDEHRGDGGEGGSGGGGGSSGDQRFGSCEQRMSCNLPPDRRYVPLKLECERDGDSMACTCSLDRMEFATCDQPDICRLRHDAGEREDDGRDQALLDILNSCCGSDYFLSPDLLTEDGCDPIGAGEHILP